ncbi:hypothetical protein ABFY54_28900 [Priestia megaterium]|uniref:hypothetical protein n=1 Tax=Priestia megaterium TaxID=1404 RepID=UPI003D2E6330
MLNYKLNKDIQRTPLTFIEKREIDKLIYESVDIYGNYSTGIFEHTLLDKIIRSYIHELPTRKYKGRDSISFEQLCSEMFEDSDTKRRYDWFVPIIAEKINRPFPEAEQFVLLRLMMIYQGIVGEGILEKLIINSDIFELVSIEKSRDYQDHVDLLIRHKPTGNEIYIQVKKSTFYYSPSDWHKGKIEEAKRVHKDKKITCEFAFFHYDFETRHFIINGHIFAFKGYGRSKIYKNSFEKFLMAQVFDKHYLHF